MLRVISTIAILGQVLFPTAPPGIAQSDAYARANGDRKMVAVRIGEQIFHTMWPAQVLNVYADGIKGHDVAGLRLSGEHFHDPLTRAQFISEIADLAESALAAAPIDEVDIWASVPIPVAKGTVVAGDLAAPTWRNVFSVTVRRGEGRDALVKRIEQGTDVFWDQDWERTAFKVERS